MFFASLKDSGQISEFIPEQARVYIANKRLEAYEAVQLKELQDGTIGGVAPWSTKIELTDEDQSLIMNKQSKADLTMLLASGPSTTVVTDSSPLNALFYMSPESRKKHVDLAKEVASRTSIFFYVKPVAFTSGDFNRIHSEKFSKELDDQILPLLAECVPEIIPKIIPLIGRAEERKNQALSAYYHLKFPQGP